MGLLSARQPKCPSSSQLVALARSRIAVIDSLALARRAARKMKIQATAKPTTS